MRARWLLLVGATAAVPTGHVPAQTLEATRTLFELGNQLRDLETTHAALTADHAALVAKHEAMRKGHAAMEADYKSLMETHAAMDADCKAFAARHAEGLPGAFASAVAAEECVISDFVTLEDHFDFIDPESDEVEVRIEQMDTFGISRLMASHAGDIKALNYSDPTLTTESIKALMRAWNNATLAGARSTDGRMRGLCNVYLSEVDASIAEINWCNEQGVVGIMVFGHQTTVSGDTMHFNYYYDAESLRFWKEAARLDMFVYIHPHDLPFGPDGLFDADTHVMPDGIEIGGANWLESGGINLTSTVKVDAYDPNSNDAACASNFQGALWGYAVSVSQVVYNLVVHGVFDEVPDLKMVIGHTGELISFWLPRIDYKLASSTSSCIPNASAVSPTGFQHNFTYYFRKHFWITTSGNFDTAGLKHLMALMPEDRLLFSVDSPLSAIEDAVTWFRGIPTTNPEISCETLQKVAYKNAEALLKWSNPTYSSRESTRHHAG